MKRGTYVVVLREGELRVLHKERGFRDVLVAREIVNQQTAARIAVVRELERALAGLHALCLAGGAVSSSPQFEAAGRVLKRLAKLQRTKPLKVDP